MLVSLATHIPPDEEDDDSRPRRRLGATASSAGPGPRRLSVVPTPDDDLAAQRATKWELAESIATDEAILDRLIESCRNGGVVGEERALKVIYLAATSRVLPEPVSLAIKGSSSAGKSRVVEAVLERLPAPAYLTMTAMSEKALVYSNESFVHRMLIIFEAEGLHSRFLAYLIRSLLSEARSHYETVERGSPRRIEKAGPTGLITTTTAAKLHPENETRMFSVLLTETQEQTRAVLRSLAEARREPDDLDVWIGFQEWVALGSYEVSIPYARKLVELVPPIHPRLKRDVKAVLNLIRAHTLLHQAARDRDSEGSIVATLDDYRVVRELVADLLGAGVELMVPATIREVVEAVAEGCTTVRSVAVRLRIDVSSASRRIAQALELGYAIKNEARPGRLFDLCPGRPLPEDVDILPNVEQIK